MKKIEVNINPPYGSHITEQEQAILTSIQAARGVGFRDGMKACNARIEELEGMIATLDQENRQLNARNERLEKENSTKANQECNSEDKFKLVAWGWLGKEGYIYDIITPEEHDNVEGSYTVPLYMYKNRGKS